MSLLALTAAHLIAAGTRSLSADLGPEGDVYAWLVSQPFPDPGAFALNGAGFKSDLLGSEADAAPVEEHGWRLVLGDRKRGLDLAAALGQRDAAVAYAYAELDSPADQDARLLFGSDDGAKVFLNGSVVFDRELARGVQRDSDAVTIHLHRGLNRLLFKVEQLNQGWGLMARVVDLKGHSIRGLTESVQVDPTTQDRYKLARSLTGTEGSLNVEALEHYEASEARVKRWLRTMRSRALDPERLDRALSEADTHVGQARDVADLSSALLQADASIDGAFTHSRSRLLAWAQHPGPLFSAHPASEDFIRVLPLGRYFCDERDKPFLAIGYNHNPDWTELAYADPMADRYDPSRADAWFANLARHGVDLVRMMVGTPQSGDLEEAPGVISPEHLIWLDTIVGAARRNHVRLWITPYDTFWMNKRADASCYWSANGGPMAKPIDFLTKPAVIELQKKRMKFLIDRYGNTDTVFAWEVMNEIDLWWGASPRQIKDWTDQMVAFVRSYQGRRWGKEHLVTLSFAVAEPKGLDAETAFRRPDLDFATMHLYLGASRGPSEGQAEQAGKDYAAGVTYARSQIRDNRPVLDGESGPIDRWIVDESLDNEVFHQMCWEHLLHGGAGTGFRWPYRNPHHLTPGMLDALLAMREFCDRVPWTLLTGAEVPVTVATNGEATTFATDKAAIFWIRPVHGSIRTVRARWPEGQAPRQVAVFDLSHGHWVDVALVNGAVVLPGGLTEVALLAVK